MTTGQTNSSKSQNMVADGGLLSIASAVGSSINGTIQIAQIVYSLKAVGNQTERMIRVTNHVSSTLEKVRVLRRQKAAHLTKVENDWLDAVCKIAEDSLSEVAALIEPARVDMITRKDKKVSLGTEVMFLLRDSPKVALTIATLGLANVDLNSAMTTLSLKGSSPLLVSNNFLLSPHHNGGSPEKAPPTYEESAFLNRRRSAQSLGKGTVQPSPPATAEAQDSAPEPGDKDSVTSREACPIIPLMSPQDSLFVKDWNDSSTTIASYDSANSITPQVSQSAQSLGSGERLHNFTQPLEYGENEFLHRRRSTRSFVSEPSASSDPIAQSRSATKQPEYEEQDFLHRRRSSRSSTNISAISVTGSIRARSGTSSSDTFSFIPSLCYEGSDGLQALEHGPNKHAYTPSAPQFERYTETDFLNRRRSRVRRDGIVPIYEIGGNEIRRQSQVVDEDTATSNERSQTKFQFLVQSYDDDKGRVVHTTSKPVLDTDINIASAFDPLMFSGGFSRC